MHAQQLFKLLGIQDFLSIVPFVWLVKVTCRAPLTARLCWEPHAANVGCPSPSQEDSRREREPFFPVIPKNLPSCFLQESFCSSKRQSHPQPTTCSLSSCHSLLHISTTSCKACGRIFPSPGRWGCSCMLGSWFHQPCVLAHRGKWA